MEPQGESPAPPETVSTVGGGSVARVAAEAIGLVVALVVTTITARALGPSDKGLFSAVSFLVELLVLLFLAGMGEALIVLVGSKAFDLQRALSATLLGVAATGLIGSVLAYTLAILLVDLGDDSGAIVAVAALSVPVLTCRHVLKAALAARERMVAVGVLLAANSVLTLGAIVVFVAIADLGVPGALWATPTAGLVGMVAAGLMLRRRDGLSLVPRWDGPYLREAIRFGAPVQASNFLVRATARLDLLIVYAIAGRREAGFYSVALTAGMLVGMVPLSISYASFSRIANVDEGEARELTALTTRLGVVFGLVALVGLWLVLPVAIPLLFGESFRPAILPSVFLAASGFLYSVQWLVCRAVLARRWLRPMITSFTLTLVAMTVLDLAAVPLFGSVGAAVSSTASQAAGFALCLAMVGGAGYRVRDFLPRRSDLADLRGSLATVGRPAARRREASALDGDGRGGRRPGASP